VLFRLASSLSTAGALAMEIYVAGFRQIFKKTREEKGRGERLERVSECIEKFVAGERKVVHQMV
jgi:hypothetical protein